MSRAEKKKIARDTQKELITKLDLLLPARDVHPEPAKCVGHRSLGSTGRSLLNILEDTLEIIRQRRARRVALGMQGTMALAGAAGLPSFPQGVFPAGATLEGEARPQQGGPVVPPPAEEGASAESAGAELPSAPEF